MPAHAQAERTGAPTRGGQGSTAPAHAGATQPVGSYGATPPTPDAEATSAVQRPGPTAPAGEKDLPGLLREVGTPAELCAVVDTVARCVHTACGDAIRLTGEIENVDDATALLLAYRATALAHVGMFEAARSTFHRALYPRRRRREIRHFTLRQRADVYVSEGRRAQARRDLQRIVTEGAAVDGVGERLAALRAH